MSSARRSKESDRRRYYRDGYEDSVDVNNLYTRSYAPWQWGYWAGDNMAYSGSEGSYYIQDDRMRGRPSHFGGNVYDNAGFHGYKHGYAGGSYKLKASSTEGFSEYPGESHRRSSRRCIVVLSIVGLVFLIAAGIAIGIYFGVVDKPESIPAEPTTAAPAPVFSAYVTLTLNQAFNDDLNNPDSTAYKELEAQVLNDIDGSMNAGPQASAYSGAQVKGFSEGSVLVYVLLLLNQNTYTENGVAMVITADNLVFNLKDQLQRRQTTLTFVLASIQAAIRQGTGIAALGDTCDSPGDCGGSNQVCTGSTASVCQCESSHYDSNGAQLKGVCLEKKLYGVGCTDATNCATAGAVCEGSPKVCTCAAGKYYNQNTNTCDTKLLQGDVGCVDAALQCQVSQAKCVNQRCDCETDYRVKDNVCIRLLEFEESGCLEKADCVTPQAICAIRVCRCAPTDFYDPIDKTCKTKVEIDGACTRNSEDECKTKDAICDQATNKCKCPDTKYLNGDICSEQTGDGESCTVDDGCSFSNAKCLSNFCTCDTDRFVNNNTKSCDLKVAQGASCVGTFSDECVIDKAVCDATTKKCTCEDNKYLNVDKCSDKLQQGDVGCTDAALQCQVSEAKCVNQRCDCETDYRVKDNVCVRLLAYEESGCEDANDCVTPDATCTAGICTCESADFYDTVDKVCKIQVVYDATCTGNSDEEEECKTQDAICDPATKKCKCPDTKFLNSEIGDVCSDKTGDGESCTVDDGCSYLNAKCLSSFCTCDTDRFVNNAAKSCDLKVGLDADCTDSDQCSYTGAKCTSNKCKCPDKTYEATKSCDALKVFDQTCAENKECETGVCASGKCGCLATHYYDTTAKLCMTLKAHDEACTENKECKTGTCGSNKCSCLATHYYDSTDEVCKTLIAFDQTCAENKECETGVCASGKCGCLATHYYDTTAKLCQTLKAYDEACAENKECKTGTCDSNKCTCLATHYYDTTEKVCKTLKAYDETCAENKECETGNCDSGKCACLGTEYYDLTAKMCKTLKEYDEDCTENKECKTVTCENSKCGCLATHYFDSTAKLCKTLKVHEEACTENKECKSDLCENNKCGCLETEYYDTTATLCKTLKVYDEACAENKECKTGTCDSNKCSCLPTHYYDTTDKVCKTLKVYDEACAENKECKTGTCGSNKCACLTTHYYDTTDEMCKTKLDHKAEGCKDATLQCKTKNAVCVDEACDCDTHNYYDNGECFAQFENGETCTMVEQCKIQGSFCDITCQCKTDQYNDGTMCKSKVAFDGFCDREDVSMCKTLGGACVENKCDCRDNYVHDIDDDKCVIKKRYNESCNFDSECITENATCITDLCLCASGKFLDVIKCSDTKGNGEVCGSKDECRVEGAICDGVCKCADDEYLDGSCKPKVLLDGDCTDTFQDQCLFTGAKCTENKCKCPDETYPADKSCDALKSFGQPCSDNQECETNTCDKNQCDCLVTEYYNTTEGSCKRKSAYNEDCIDVIQCNTTNAECTTSGKCLCPVGTFLNSIICLQQLDLGVSCTVETAEDQCSYKDAQCISGACTCGEGTFVNTITSSCDQKKNNTEACSAVGECAVDGAICSGTCQCPQDKYLLEGEGKPACVLKKPNGTSCMTDMECRVDCLDDTCQCPASTYLIVQGDQETCADRLDYGSTCSADGDCKDGFLCPNAVCDCPSGYTFDGTTCMMIVTTTAIPTTPAPDEEVIIVTENELTSEEEFDSALNDNTSDAYQEKKAATEEALAVQLANRTDIAGYEVTGFESGSVIIFFDIYVKKREVYIEANIEADTIEELEEAENTVASFLNTVLKEVTKNVANDLQEKGVFRGVTVPDRPIVIKKTPCDDTGLCARRAQSSICEPVWKYTQAAPSRNERCWAYVDLLNCVAVRYRFADTSCKWNLWRQNIEEFGLAALNLKLNEVKPCVKNNRFDFNPMVYVPNPCKNPTAMKMVLKYQCRVMYSQVLTSRNKNDRCWNAKQAVNCSIGVLDTQFGSQCQEKADLDESLAMVIDDENTMFDETSIGLNTCDFCLAPNLLHTWKEDCNSAMKLLPTATPEEACSLLHMTMKCIEKHSTSCTKADMMKIFQTDGRFFNYAKQHYQVLDETSWTLCLLLGPTIGPSEPESVCQDQMYVGYFLFGECFDTTKDEESCIPLYNATECVRRHIERTTGEKCSYKAIGESIMANSSDYLTLSEILDESGGLALCIMPEAEDSCSSSMTYTRWTQGEEIINTCLYPVSNILYLPLLDKLMTYDRKNNFACSIYGQAAYCVKDLFAAKLELCTDAQFSEHIDILIQGLVKVMVEYATNSGVPAPAFGVEIYDGCSEIFATAMPVSCAAEDTVINAVTASCATSVVVVTGQEKQCGALGECTGEMQNWHRQHKELCPGFVEAVDVGQQNEDFADFFWGVTRFNWMACSEETETFYVVLFFTDDTYDEDFDDIESEAALGYIASKWELLSFLSRGRRFIVIRIYTEERTKRQTEPSSGDGVKLEVRYEASSDFEAIFREQWEKVPEKFEDENVVVEQARKEGVRGGSCPVSEAYEERCLGFKDQCQSDSDCSDEDQKCCYDGKTNFCVEPAKEPAEFMVSFRLPATDSWNELYENIDSDPSQKLIKRLNNTMVRILDVIESFNIEKISRSGNRVKLLYTVTSYSNPEEKLSEQVSSIAAGVIKLDDVFFMAPSIVGKERCPEEKRDGERFVACVEEQFRDDNFPPYQDFQVCGSVEQIVLCAETKCREAETGENCDFNDLEKKLPDELLAVIERIEQLSKEFSYDRILRMLKSYSRSECEDQGDINPCSERQTIEDSTEKCQKHIEGVDTEEPYIKDSCSALHAMSSCVFVDLRSQGAAWCDYNEVQETVFDILHKDAGLTASVKEFNRKCGDDTVPICSFIGLRQSKCYLWPYFEDGSCSNETERQGVTDFVTCARIQALKKAKENGEDDKDCGVEEIVGVIENDRYHLQMIKQDEDITGCFPGDTLEDLEEELSDIGSVCGSFAAVRRYYRDCFSPDCPLNLEDIEDETTKFTLWVQQASCLQRNMMDDSFECKLDEDILETMKKLDEDTKFPLYLGPERLDEYRSQLSEPAMKSCSQPLLSRVNGSMECVQHLHFDLSHLEQDDKCKLVSVGASCLESVTDEVDATCDPKQIAEALKQIFFASDIGVRQAECESDVVRSDKVFPTCDGTYIVKLWFENEDYNEDFAVITSPASEAFIEAVTPLLDMVFGKGKWNIRRIYSAERRKRQEPSNTDNTGVGMEVVAEGSYITKVSLSAEVANLPEEYQGQVSVSSVTIDSPELPPVDLCDESGASTLLALVETECNEEYNRQLRNWTNFRDNFDIDEALFTCRTFNKFANCGQKVVDRLKKDSTCVREAIAANKDDLTNSLHEKDINRCLGDTCEARISKQVKHCLSTKIQDQLNDGDWTCRLYNFLWHCVKSGLVDDPCDDKLIRNQLVLELYHPTDYNGWMRCNVTAERPDLCNDVQSIYRLSKDYCGNSFEPLRESCEDTLKEEAIKCVENVTRVFGDCNDDVRTLAKSVIVYMSRQYYMPNVEECFDELERDGYCPLQHMNAMCRVCAHYHEDTCFTDPECPEEHRCCYDGCKRTCLPLATEPIVLSTRILLHKETWTDELYFNEMMQDNLGEKYQKYLDGLMEALGDAVATVQPEITSFGPSDEEVNVVFEFKSFVDKDEIEDTIQEYFDDNSDGSIIHDETDISYHAMSNPVREGICPRYSFDISDDQRGCCNDIDCNGEMKCCKVGHDDYCLNPIKEELDQCNDTDAIEAAAQTKCGIDENVDLKAELASYTCGKQFETLNCISDQINMDRPRYTECTLGNLGNTLNLRRCTVWQLQLTVEVTYCDLEAEAFVEYNEKKKAVLDLPLLEGYQLRQEFCRYQKFRTVLRFSSDLEYDELKNQIQEGFMDDEPALRKKREVPESLQPDISLEPVDLEREDWCSDNEMAKRLSLKCARWKASTLYEDFQTCSPATNFFDCVKDQFRELPNPDSEGGCELSDTVFKNDIIPYLRSELPTSFKAYLDKLDFFNPTSCGSQSIELSPCFDEVIQAEAYTNCSQTNPIPEFSSISPAFCISFYKLSSCVGTTLRSKGSRCRFYDVEEYVFKELKRRRADQEVDPLPEHYHGLNCSDHRPVCTAASIWESQEERCSSHMTKTDSNSCSNDEEKKVFKKFVTCNAIHALMMGETDCSASDIIDIINQDTYKLNIANRDVDTTTCISEEDKNALSAELTMGDNLCMSGVFIGFLALDSVDVEDECDGRGTLEDVPPESSCSFLAPTMMTVQRKVSENLELTCELTDLIDTELSEDSMLTLPAETRTACKDEVIKDDCVRDAFFANSEQAMDCAKNTYREAMAMDDTTEESPSCSMYKYTLTCLKTLLPAECEASVSDINEGYHRLLDYMAIDMSLKHCDEYSEPEPFPNCPVPESLDDENSCSNTEFVAEVTMGECGPEFKEMTEMYEDNEDALCLIYSRLLDCGRKATGKFLTAPDEEEVSCSREEVNSALQDNADMVKQVLSIDPTECRDECYLSMYEEASKCSRLVLGIGMDRNGHDMKWQRSCRAYRYAYQCTDTALPDCDKDLKIMALDHIIGTIEDYTQCRNPKNQVPLDICSNATDLMELSNDKCVHFVYGLTITPTESLEPGKCYYQTELKDCMKPVMGMFTDMEEDMPCGEKTDDIIFKASLMAARKQSMHDVKEMEKRSALIKTCFGGVDREGSCPYVENFISEGTSTCALDEECEDQTHRCCFDSSSFNCRPPYTELERYQARLGLPDLPWKPTFGDFDADETQEAIEEPLTFVEAVCEEQKWRCTSYMLEQHKESYRKKRALDESETGYTVLSFQIYASQSPEMVLTVKIAESGKNYELDSFDFSPEETPGMCPIQYDECSVYQAPECYRDYHCRIQHGKGFKCCHECGNRCELVGDPEICQPLFDQHWDECSMLKDFEMEEFRPVLDYMPWTSEQCSALKRITECISEESESKECGETYFSQMTFYNIIEQLGRNPDYYGYPKECGEVREGYCPILKEDDDDACKSELYCSKDTECKEEGMKCCDNPCGYKHCVKALDEKPLEKERYRVVLLLLKEPFQDEYNSRSNKATMDLVERIYPLLEILFDEILKLPFRIVSFDRQEQDRVKRQEPEQFDQTLVNIETESERQPDIMGAIDSSNELKEEIAFEDSTVIEKPNPEECEDSEDLFNKVKDTCDSDILFTNEYMSEEKCSAYTRFKECVEWECGTDKVDIDWERYFELHKDENSGSEEDEGFNLDPEKCSSDNPCWSEESIKNVAREYCSENITRLADRGPMTKHVCNDVWEVVKCVTRSMKMKHMMTCRKEVIEGKIAPLLRTDELSENFEELDFTSFDMDFCKELVCYPSGLMALARDDCADPVKAYRKHDNCIHMTMFAGCSKFNALGKDSDCTIEDVTHYMKDIGNEIWTTSEDIYRDFSICPSKCTKSWKVTDEVQVTWSISSDYNEHAEFFIELTGESRLTEGSWIGLGISDDGNMIGSDIVTFTWQSGESVPEFQNRYAQEKNVPGVAVDPREPEEYAADYTSDDAGTYIDFWRPRDAMDPSRDKALNGPKYLVLAMGKLDSQGNLLYHEARYTSPEAFNFECSDNQFEEEFPSPAPDILEQICTYWGLNHFNLRYGCLPDTDVSFVPAGKLKCILKEFGIGCVNERLTEDFSCGMDATREAFEDERTVEDFFDKDPDCSPVMRDLNLDDCEKKVTNAGKSVSDVCVASAASFTQLGMHGIDTNIPGPSENGNGKPLKCSLLEDAIDCYMRFKPFTDTEGDVCGADSYKRVLNWNIQVYQYIVIGQLNGTVEPETFEALVFDDCSIDSELDINYDGCPTGNVIVGQIMARCLPTLLVTAKIYLPTGYDSLCPFDSMFTECAMSPEILRLGNCSREEKMSALDEYEDYVQEVTDGYSPNKCKGYSVCVEDVFPKHYECILKFSALPLLAAQMDFKQECTLLSHYDREAKECLREKVDDDCSDYIDSYVAGIGLSPDMQKAFSDREKCSDDDIDICGALQQFGVMECGWYELARADPYYTCLMRSCFENLKIPEDCGAIDRQSLADKAINETYFHEIGTCEKSECRYGEEYIPSGMSRETEDGCNTCQCNNGLLTCTQDTCPLSNFEVDLGLPNVPYLEDYSNPESGPYKELNERIQPWVEALSNALNLKFDVLGFYHSSVRVKRQTQEDDPPTESGTSVKLSTQAVRLYAEMIEDAIARNQDLSDNFVFGGVSKIVPSPCTPEYFDTAISDTCDKSWKWLVQNKTCEHYVQFLSCVLFQDLMGDEKCTLGDVHKAMKNKTMEKGLPNEFCPTDLTQAFVESVFPNTKAGICNNWYTTKHILRYYCLDLERYNKAEPQDQCLMEYGGAICVTWKTYPAGCNVTQTYAVFQNDPLREDLLEDEASCETNYPCARSIVVDNGPDIMDSCLETFDDLHSSNYVGDLDGYSDEARPLKCLANQYTMQCINTHFGDKLHSTCTDKFKAQPAVLHLIDLKTGLDEDDEDDTSDWESAVTFYEECTDDLEWPGELIDECPNEWQLITIITASCAEDVKDAMMKSEESEESEEGCRFLQRCFEHIEEWYNEEGDMCNAEMGPNIEEKLENAMNNTGFADYFEEATSLNWLTCSKYGDEGCWYDDEMKKHGERFDSGDGCNTCFCDNGMVGCTEMACSNTYIVELRFPNDPYNEEYATITSTAAEKLIEEATPLLNTLFGEGSWTITRIYSTAARRKRQVPENTDNSDTGVGIELEVTGYDLTVEGLTDNIPDDDKENVIVYSVTQVVIDTCEAVGCPELECEHSHKPEDKCCEVCTRECAKEEVNCLVAPCDHATCTNYKKEEVTCVDNYCGGCNAQFIDSSGRDVTSMCEYEDRETRCNKPVDRGNCTNEMPSWFYNSNSEQCEEFSYTGCAGNTNRFLTEGMCKMHCETDCSEVNCSEVDCKSTEQYCCKSCFEVKPGFCPRVDKAEDVVSSCDVECEKDSECDGNQKCCSKACGMGQCVDPEDEEPGEERTYIVKLRFPDDPYNEDYAIITSTDAENYIEEVTPLLDELFGEGLWEIIAITRSNPAPSRRKRQTPENSDDTGVDIEVEVRATHDMTVETVTDKVPDDNNVVVVSVVPDSGCARGVETVECFASPCLNAKCPNYNTSRCVENYCGDCNAQFVLQGGRDVTSMCEDEDRETRCSQPVDRGNCKNEMQSWFYNSNSEQCEEFSYTGCAGNTNRFLTEGMCVTHCALECSEVDCLSVDCKSTEQYCCKSCFEEHEGYCPRFEAEDDVSSCDVECEKDSDCGESEKCCNKPCGRGQCVDSQAENPLEEICEEVVSDQAATPFLDMTALTPNKCSVLGEAVRQFMQLQQFEERDVVECLLKKLGETKQDIVTELLECDPDSTEGGDTGPTPP